MEAAPISSPRDWATRAVAVDRAEKRRKRLVSAGWPVIQYTMLQYTAGHSTWGAAEGWAGALRPAPTPDGTPWHCCAEAAVPRPVPTPRSHVPSLSA